MLLSDVEMIMYEFNPTTLTIEKTTVQRLSNVSIQTYKITIIPTNTNDKTNTIFIHNTDEIMQILMSN